MKFFHEVTLGRPWNAIRIPRSLGRPWNAIRIPRSKNRKKLPVVLSMQEMQSLLCSVDNLKHQAILTTIYSGGLRLGEATRLKVSDIDSKRMTILIQGGKGNKDRYTLLGQRTLQLLRLYWKAYHPVEWLFPSKDPAQPLSGSSVQRVFKKALQRAGIKKKVSVHTLIASRPICSNRAPISTTSSVFWVIAQRKRHLHITGRDLAKVKSPIDLLPSDQKPTP